MSTFVRLVALAGRWRWWLALATLLTFATLGTNVALIAFSAYLVTKAATVASTADLTVAITAVRAFAVARAASRYAERYVGHVATFGVLTRLRVWYFRHLEPLVPAVLGRHHSADVAVRIGADVETLQEFYLRALIPPMAAALTVALAGAVLGVLDPALGVVLVAFLVVTGVVVPGLTRRWSRSSATAMVAERAELHVAVVDGAQGRAELVALGAADAQRARIDAAADALAHLERHLAVRRGATEALAALLVGLAATSLTGLAVSAVGDGRLDAILLAVVPLTAIAAFDAVTPLGAAMTDLDRSRAAAERLFALVDTEPAVVDPPHPAPAPIGHDLRVDGLTFAYAPDEPPVLRDVSFTVPDGSWTAMVGPSGSGKSTLVALLLRFWPSSEGEIRLGGVELRDLCADELRRRFAVVSQHDHLFDTTVADNLRLADADATDAALVEVCRLAAIHDVVSALPDGYATRLGEDGWRLSGGERQRLLVARALLREAPILVLDEATAHLDPATEAQVLGAIRRHRAGRTTLVIAHHADRLGVPDHLIRLAPTTPTTPTTDAPPAAGRTEPAVNPGGRT